jgi:SanA protein
MLKKDLIKRGIPASKIFLDYAGFRTLDSVVRCREIFGQHAVTIISQPFHNERAVFIARNKGIKAIGFNARDVNKYYGFKTQAREKLARGKMVLDLIFNKQPRFLGEKIIIQ